MCYYCYCFFFIIFARISSFIIFGLLFSVALSFRNSTFFSIGCQLLLCSLQDRSLLSFFCSDVDHFSRRKKIFVWAIWNQISMELCLVSKSSRMFYAHWVWFDLISPFILSCLCLCVLVKLVRSYSYSVSSLFIPRSYFRYKHFDGLCCDLSWMCERLTWILYAHTQPRSPHAQLLMLCALCL